MEGHFSPTREEFYNVQMDVKHVQAVQNEHADRLLRLEKRQADDAALKSVWNSPFPSVMGGTPQQGPVPQPPAEVFGDFDDDHGQNLLGSLQLDAEEEPIRRGASRANSVRFDVSTLHGSNWPQGSRSSGDFGMIRPGSGLGSHPMIEPSFSHKSDGRHSSTGHSIHSIHSAPSGRTSSLGLDTNFMIGGKMDDAPLDIPAPPPGLFVLGTVPSIIRCWLTEKFSHTSLLYAAVCSGSQKSMLDFSLVQELDLVPKLQKASSGDYHIKLPVYLPEALVTQATSRTSSPAQHLPTMMVSFNVTGVSQYQNNDCKQRIRIFLGSDSLRAYSCDILFSQNLMTLYGDDRIKLLVPFVRPEDESSFKFLHTAHIASGKLELKATALPFTPSEQKHNDSSLTNGKESMPNSKLQGPTNKVAYVIPDTNTSPRSENQHARHGLGSLNAFNSSESLRDNHSYQRDRNIYQDHEASAKDASIDSQAEYHGRQESSGSIWGSWRTGGVPSNDIDGAPDSTSNSNYQKPGRGGRSMKVLKPFRAPQRDRSSSAARASAAYEPPVQRISGEGRRKSQAGISEADGSLRWEWKRVVSGEKPSKEARVNTSAPRSLNPIGGASAFAWMNSSTPITTSSRAD